MKGWGIAVVWLPLVVFATPAVAAPVVLDESSRQFPLAGHLEAFHDASGELTQDQVASSDYTQDFMPLPGNFNGGYRRTGAWWVRFELRAAPGAGTDWWLHLGAPYVDRLDVWLPERTAAGVVLRHRVLGGAYPVSARDLPWTVPTLHLAAVPEEGGHRVWMRMAGDRSINLLGYIWKLDAMTGFFQGVAYRVAIILGTALMLAVVALMLGVALPDAKFRWYAAYLAVTGLAVACSENVVATFLLPDQPLAALRVQHIAVPLSVWASLMFAHSQLELREQFARVAFAFRALAAVSLLATALSALGYYGLVAPLANLARLLLNLVIIVLCVLLLWRGQAGAWPNLIGYAVYGATTLLFFAKNLDWVPFTRWTQYSYVAGLLVHMLAIFLALGLRVRGRERRALADSLEAGARLEANVAARTRELRDEVERRRRIEAALQVENRQRQDAQDELQAAMDEQRNFLSMVSHELRNPLSIIGVSAEMIADERLAPSFDDARREAERISRAKQQMLGLIDTLLADDWLESSAIQLDRGDVDLAELLSDKAQEHGDVSGRAIRFDAQGGPPGELRVWADERLLHIVFDNLIENAIKYSPADGAVELSAQRAGGCIQVSVRDHGDGFDQADIGRVFERFYRAESVRQKPGVGLGLYMVSRIVELHGGSVRAADAAGGGAVLIVELPTRGGVRGRTAPPESSPVPLASPATNATEATNRVPGCNKPHKN